MSTIKVVDPSQMRQIEETSSMKGLSTSDLIDRAGEAIAKKILALYPVKTNITILVGPGNNGSDGLVAAQYLANNGYRIWIYLCAPINKIQSSFLPNSDTGINIASVDQDTKLSTLTGILNKSTIVIDSILGTGQNRPISEPIKSILLKLGEIKSRKPNLKLVSVDVPSGINANSGSIDPSCQIANLTIALGFPKIGLFSLQCADFVGRLCVEDIGLKYTLSHSNSIELLTDDWASKHVPRRQPTSNKGSHGKVLIVAGSENYIGAAHLASMGAYRSGTGLVTLATAKSLVAPLSTAAPEPTYLPLPENEMGSIGDGASALILNKVTGHNSLLLGCGLGQSFSSRRLVEEILYSSRRLPPTVVDADALNILSLNNSANSPWWKMFDHEAILTPHPGEMGRLRRDDYARTNPDRIGLARDSAKQWDKVVVLKGANTVIASPEGRVLVSPFVNPGLATAGTGDILSGIITSLLAQGLSLMTAAGLGVYLHGLAGDRSVENYGVVGTIASDLLKEIPRSIRYLEGKFTGGNPGTP